MRNILILIVVVLFAFSCKDDKKTTVKEPTTKPQEDVDIFDDSKYVVDESFSIGDARRYGASPENARKAHPTSGKNRLMTVLDLAEESDMEISFPSGYYAMNLSLDSRKNMKLRFNNSEFNAITIIEKKGSEQKPENISLKGTLISNSRLGITEAINIAIDSVILKSDIEKNPRGLRNTGCHIYHGCKDIKINYLEVQDLGSGNDKYKYSHAALAVDGWNNNPENVQIKKLYIKSTDRHGIYLTGKDHLIGDVVIDKFGVGSSNEMAGMQDAVKGEEKDFKALWVNKCYNSFIENITINENNSKGKYTAHFDYGDKNNPVTIGTFTVLNDTDKINILEEDTNGVIIEIRE